MIRIGIMKNKYFRTSVSHAMEGLLYTAYNERNFRIDIVCAMYVIWFASACRLSEIEWLFVISAVGLVLIAETFNTALERAVDSFSEAYNEAAKNSKDASAGAVVICALLAAAVGIAVFADSIRIFMAVETITSSAVRLFVFAAITIFAVWFIFLFGKKREDRKGKI